MKPEDWVKLLYTYGPFALLVFFMFVGEARARSALKDPGVSRKVSLTIYAANWAVVFTLLGFALSAWYRLTFNSEFTIRGTVLNLQGNETLHSRDNNLFLSKVYEPGGHFHYDWRLITERKLQNGVPFELDLSTSESEKTLNYILPIHSDSYGQVLTLTYNRSNDNLRVHDGSADEDLKPQSPDELARRERPEPIPSSLFVWKVEAQAAQQAVPLQDRLEASDPNIRRQARQDLAQQTTQQWSYIDAALSDPNSSYRVKLGVIYALNANKCADISKLSPAALTSVARASGDPDPTLRGLARGCLLAQPSPSVVAGLDSSLHSSSGKAGNNSEVARTELEVLYSLGIAAKDRYGSRQAKDRKEFDRAVEYFHKAWGLRQFASPPDQVLFAKALYGWGLALHDRSWVDRNSSGQRRPEHVRAAQDKFSEFLKEVRSGGNPASYPYPQHLRQAEAYVKNPVPQSLQLN